MKVAIVYNRDSKRVINLFGLPNREKYGLNVIAVSREGKVLRWRWGLDELAAARELDELASRARQAR